MLTWQKPRQRAAATFSEGLAEDGGLGEGWGARLRALLPLRVVKLCRLFEDRPFVRVPLHREEPKETLQAGLTMQAG